MEKGATPTTILLDVSNLLDHTNSDTKYNNSNNIISTI